MFIPLYLYVKNKIQKNIDFFKLHFHSFNLSKQVLRI